MYINANCPYCGRNIKKFGSTILKPGIITCPDCKKMSFVTGLGFGLIAYIFSSVVLAIILKNFTPSLGTEVTLIIYTCIMIIAVFVMSLFLDLTKQKTKNTI